MTPAVDKAVQLYYQLYELYKVHNPGCVHLDVVDTMGLLVKKLGPKFSHLRVLGEILETGMSNPDDLDACAKCVSLIGSPLATSFDQDFAQFADTFVEAVLKLLESSSNTPKLAIGCLTTLGDIALILNTGMEKFLPRLGGLLTSAGSVEMQDENVSDVNLLREAGLECYVSLLHGGLSSISIQPYVLGLLGLLEKITIDNRQKRSSVEVIKNSISSLGDLVLIFKKDFVDYVKNLPWINELTQQARELPDSQQPLNNLQVLLQNYA